MYSKKWELILALMFLLNISASISLTFMMDGKMDFFTIFDGLLLFCWIGWCSIIFMVFANYYTKKSTEINPVVRFLANFGAFSLLLLQILFLVLAHLEGYGPGLGMALAFFPLAYNIFAPILVIICGSIIYWIGTVLRTMK